MTLPETVAFSATGGKPPYVDWELTPIGASKALPNGLLQKKPDNGVGNGSILFGTITENGTYNFTATVTDSLRNKCSKNHTIVVYPKLEITTPSPLPVAYRGPNYSATINATGGKTCYSWTLNSTSVDPQDFGDLKIASSTCISSVITGIPKKVGNYTVTVTATDACGQTANKTYTIEVKKSCFEDCLKGVWVVVEGNDGFHSCNRDFFCIDAGPPGKDRTPILYANLNNGCSDPKDWNVNPGGAKILIPSYSNGNGRESSFASPFGIALDATGKEIYVADSDRMINRIRKITTNSTQTIKNYGVSGNYSTVNFGNVTSNVTTFAGGNTDNTFSDGIGSNASFSRPGGIAIDNSNNLYVADTGNHRIRKIASDGTVSTLAGNGTDGFADGNSTTSVMFKAPSAVAVVGNGTLYVADTGNNIIRKIKPDGTVSTLAGKLETPQKVNLQEFTLNVTVNQTNELTVKVDSKEKPPTQLQLFNSLAPGAWVEVTVNNITTNTTIDSIVDFHKRIISLDSIIPNSGNGTLKFYSGNLTDGIGTKVGFSSPTGIAVSDDNGNISIYVADTGNNRIRMIKEDGNSSVTTVAGVGTFILDRMRTIDNPYRTNPSANCNFAGAGKYNRIFLPLNILDSIVNKNGGCEESSIEISAFCADGSCSHSTGIGKLTISTTKSDKGEFSELTSNQTINPFVPDKPQKVTLCTTANAISTTNPLSAAAIISPLFTKTSLSLAGESLNDFEDSGMKTVSYSPSSVFSGAPQLNNIYLIQSSKFNVGIYEIPIQQYTSFLNSVAKADPNNLFNTLMQNIGIKRSIINGNYKYSIEPGSENYPVTYVSWYDAARYTNWLANGKPSAPQGSSTTENGVYNLASTTIARNSINPNTGAPPTFWLLNESEWYTSAYLKTDGSALWTYPTQSDTAPESSGNTPSNFANFGGVFGETTPVGFFDQSPGPFGTFDQAGNVREWTETLDNSSTGPMRIIRGGSWADPVEVMKADESQISDPTLEDDKTGFRIGGAP